MPDARTAKRPRLDRTGDLCDITTMTKDQELFILTEAATKLGTDSYCGPWLLDVLDELERDIRSDLPPCPSPAESRRQAESIIAEARSQAATIIMNAKDQADRERKQARHEAESIRSNIRSTIAKCSSLIGGWS
jgi:hypothetical protein